MRLQQNIILVNPSANVKICIYWQNNFCDPLCSDQRTFPIMMVLLKIPVLLMGWPPYLFLLSLSFQVIGATEDRAPEYVLKLSPNFTLSMLPTWENTSRTILLSLDEKESNETHDLLIRCLNEVALQNRQKAVSREMWISLTLQGDGSSDIDRVVNITKNVNAISNGTITTVLLDYGLLQLTAVSLPEVRQDLRMCSRKVASANLRCGLIIDSLNCLTSLSHITQVGLSSGDVFIINDDFLTYRRGETLLSVATCIWKFQSTEVLLGYKIDMALNVTTGANSGHVTSSRKRRELIDELRFDYIILQMQSRKFYRDDVRKFSPIKDEQAWLSRPVDFNKTLFGTSLAPEHFFLLEDKQNWVSLLERFRSIIFEVGHSFEPYVLNFVQNLAREARELFSYPTHTVDEVDGHFEKNIPPQLTLVMDIVEDFESNKRILDNLLLAVAVGNKEYPGFVSSVIFNWVQPLQTSNTWSEVVTKTDEAILEKFLNQSMEVLRILKYTKTQRLPSVRIGVMWEFELIKAIEDSELDPEFRDKLGDYVEMQKIYVNTIILQVSISMTRLEREGLLYLSRTLIYQLTPEIYLLYPYAAVELYVGIAGCDGRPYSNGTFLKEYLLFWEILHNWAVLKGVKVFMNTAFEMEIENYAEQCPKTHYIPSGSPCMCGWWQVSKEDKRLHEDKKSIARRLYTDAGKPETKEDIPDEKVFPFANIVIILVSVGGLLFCMAVAAVTGYAINYYRSKNIISKMEVRAFLLGSKTSASRVPENDGSGNAHCVPYDIQRYEVLPSSYTVDFNCPLGEGEYSAVYRGAITKSGETSEVAVKMKSRRLSADSQKHGNLLALRGLISEIKILTYVSGHPNIVKLEGAYTAKLRKGIALVFLELCPMGSFDKHLRTYTLEDNSTRRGRDDLEETGVVANDNVVQGNYENNESWEHVLPAELENDLRKWSLEIVSGMKYLTAKKLVHADLATRNVLLDASKTAKISDFGLSRRLYSYSEYVKQEQASLPWRWMAPESLRKLVFNEKTDVWAFGVTLWEMYTLGDLPYPGLSYHINFPALLSMPTEIGGIRMGRPKYSSNRIYELMQQCCEIYAAERPTFEELQTILSGVP